MKWDWEGTGILDQSNSLEEFLAKNTIALQWTEWGGSMNGNGMRDEHGTLFELIAVYIRREWGPALTTIGCYIVLT